MLSRREVLQASGFLAGSMAFGAAGAQQPGVSRLCYAPATELLRSFWEGKLKPLDVLEAQIRQIETFNPKVNCITRTHFDEARRQAEESQKRYKAGNPRPLEGVTIAVKDEYAVKGWVTTMGSRLLEHAPPEPADGPVIERLRAAGAIFHIQTTVPEFYSWMTTATPLWGVTRNPWNLAFSPGGSSGGSGAALAAGFTTLALGSDMGGSIRIPASQCGLYGFKPPFGRVPTSEVPYETQGPMARVFDDLNLLTQAMVGPHPAVHSSLRPKLNFPVSYAPVSGWKLAYYDGAGMSAMEPAVRAAMDGALAKFRGLGATVEAVDLGFRARDIDTFIAGLFSTSMGGLATEAMKGPEKLAEYTRFILGRLKGKTGPEALVAADALLERYHTTVQKQVFGRGFDAIVMPTMATPLVPAAHGLAPAQDTVSIGGRNAPGLDFAFTWPWNLLGRYPVVAAPAGMGPAHMPVGLQLITNTFDDLKVFQLAAAWAGVAQPLFTGDAFPKIT